jgi:hypothetical protein
MLRYFPGGFAAVRRRLAPLVLVLGLVVVGKLAYDDVPQERVLRYVLPGDDVQLLRVTYSAGSDAYGGLERRFPEGAPREFVHAPSLPPGRYELQIELTAAGGRVTRLTRSVQLPSDGPVRITMDQPH